MGCCVLIIGIDMRKRERERIKYKYIYEDFIFVMLIYNVMNLCK